MTDLKNISQHRAIGAFVCIAALAALVLWLPNDVDSGLIEKVRRRYQIGDLLAPVVALATILAGGSWLLLSKDHQPVGDLNGPVRAILISLAVIALSLVLMRWGGPASVWIGEAAGLVEAGTGYRPLRDTLPWKFIGFLTGGTVMIWALSAIADGGWTWRRLATAFLIAFTIGAVFDLPFEDLVLPPNGDV
ncbi:MAG: hypothetical protein CNE93_01305 [SAR116 cluster bacterium MED-G06]|nr:MAG: hypothetical protein CNE93_01305 [SAR116 cluster bacterium MED-G06]